MTNVKLMDWARSRHEYWWRQLCNNVHVPEGTDLVTPRCDFTDKVSNIAGKANSTWCSYNLNYLFKVKEGFDSTFAHEVCHTFINRMRAKNPNITRINGGHCPLFFYLFNVVLMQNRNEYHSYGKCFLTDEVKAMRKIKKLQAQIAALED